MVGIRMVLLMKIIRDDYDNGDYNDYGHIVFQLSIRWDHRKIISLALHYMKSSLK
jgi:hypothetical protein